MTTLTRKFFTQKRRRLSPKERLYNAKKANLSLVKLRPLLPKNAKIALYQDSFGELPTFGIVQFCLKNGFTPYVPIVKGNKMVFAPIITKNNSHFAFYHTPQKKHKLGMSEPITSKVVTIDKIDACFCPLVAIDKMGTRMGMGGGFYDRTLQHYQGIKIGWCYEFQRVEQLTTNAWDIKINITITPNGCYYH